MTILILIATLGMWLELRPAPLASDGRFNQVDNAVWLGIEWVNEPPSQPEVAALAANLVRRQIRTVYVYTTYLRPNGAFGATHAHATDFTKALKAAHPDLVIQAWIGLPLHRPGVMSSGYVVLDAVTRQRIAAFSARLVQTGGFDGLHLDPEPIVSGDTEVLALLDEVRAALPPDKGLSIATRRIWPFWPDVPWPVVGVWAWRGDYYREVARRVDQVALMTYDSALPTTGLYRWWGQRQVVALSQVLADSQVEVLIGIPTSEEKTLTHWPHAETMTSGLYGVLDGLTDAAARPSTVTGVAIYPYWETDDAEWAVYEKVWLGE